MSSQPFVQRAFWTSLALGLASMALVSDSQWGVGFSIFAILTSVGVMLAGRKANLKVSKSTKLLLGTATAFACLVAWRDAPELRILNVFCIAVALGLATLRARQGAVRAVSIFDVTTGIVAEWFSTIGDGFMLLFHDMSRSIDRTSKSTATSTAVARGVFVSVPLVLVFGGLLFSADSSFENLVRGAFIFDGATIASNLVVLAIGTVLVAGLTRRFFQSPTRAPMPKLPPPPLVLAPNYHPQYRAPAQNRLGLVEVAIVLGTLDALFLVFTYLQLPYLFGGAHHIAVTAHLSAADYAKRGFFELVSVVGLAIPTLVGLFAVLKDRSKKTMAIVGPMAALLVLLMLVVLASAAQRMGLYIDYFGLSRLRLYVAAALIWMGLVLVWFSLTTVRGKPERFAFGGVGALLAVVFMLNVISPDATVAAFNLRPERVKRFDPQYLAILSDDATPAIVAALPRLTLDQQRILKESREHLHDNGDDSWRSQNLSRLLASR